MPAEPQRKPEPNHDLGICQTCARAWREVEADGGCKTPSDCAWVRFASNREAT